MFQATLLLIPALTITIFIALTHSTPVINDPSHTAQPLSEGLTAQATAEGYNEYIPPRYVDIWMYEDTVCGKDSLERKRLLIQDLFYGTEPVRAGCYNLLPQYRSAWIKAMSAFCEVYAVSSTGCVGGEEGGKPLPSGEGRYMAEEGEGIVLFTVCK
ncbi:hypothetical protein CLAFUW4_11939 [Fulvia fulva]|uniref:Uncharacterized protein n=1 Tax=Passalora fulva TaxID=5499 RepID=A0A9Q8PET2_PASFU|nr:uncharacterized protein CLAFUR5_10982 [Fulvia fulva]KAK4617628.1 hypothetical protein CLAFUR4_11944 [Fulvia fulva]KAK4618554.1 hypothetical protein CLAFUR0_11955 [Fulvia fulva]UJO21106.1 hypothetical protein CLAFUR5_10982 [Fulvia fulva]WPV17980.1 hypothetical protein CLAFUW4_11939 [Fulvia fulva]WPV33399.1 hypothetical protein CLAFUW7_11946 [Fulvia fulva]